MTNPERRIKRQRTRAQRASGEMTAETLLQLRFNRGIVTRAELEADVRGVGVFGIPPTPEAISDPRFVGHVQAGDEAAAGLLPVDGAVGYDVYVGRYTGPAW